MGTADDPHRLRRRSGLLALVVTVALLGFWAGQQTLQGQERPQDASRPLLTAAVVDATVGRSLNVGVTVNQPVEPLATNQLPGVVTSLERLPTYDLGAVVYAVAGVPVRLVEGAVPFYRPLTPGLRGEDVRQLHTALRDLRLTRTGPGDAYGPAVETAVRAWQRAQGQPETGTVALGELVAVPELPAALRVGDDIRLGGTLAGGEDAVLGRTGAREFTLVLSEEQGRAVAEDTLVRVTYQSETWDATISGSRVDADGNPVRVLSAPGGGEVCGAGCGALPGDETVNLRGEAVVVPEVTGPAVPATAVRTGSDGKSYVTLEDGSRRGVTLRGSGQGIAVVDGVTAGQRVVVSGDDPVGLRAEPPAATGGGS